MIIAPQPQPKILSVVTVPTGGWQLRIKISDAGSLDTTLTATLAAGDYFVAWDQQSDDFIKSLNAAIITATDASVTSTTGDVHIWINSDHKVVIDFEGPYYEGATHQDVSIVWTALDGASIGAVLGFDTSADDTDTSNDHARFTSDYPHAYGWYADQDGAIAEDLPHDISEFQGSQAVSTGGHIKSQFLAARYSNRLGLQFLPEDKTWSNDVGYTAAAVYPYTRNEPLECWWKEARQGKRFRVYRDGQINTARFADTGTATGSSSTTLTDSGKVWSATPQRWAGRILYMPDLTDNLGAPGQWYIVSNTATVLTVNASATAVLSSLTYFIFEQTYKTYVLDLAQMTKFEPRERPAINRYDIALPLLRYVA